MPERESYHRPVLPLENPTSPPSILRMEESPAVDPVLEEYLFELSERQLLDLPAISLTEFRDILLWRAGKETGK